MTITPSIDSPSYALTNWPALPDVSVLISGPPIKDPGALLRYALPINNKAIREVQKPLEDITESLKVAGVRALDSVERVSFFNVLIFFCFLVLFYMFSLLKLFGQHLFTKIHFSLAHN